MPPGGDWRDLPDDAARDYMGGSWYLGGGKTGMARRLSLEEPSLTLTCSPCQKQTERCHPLFTRPLSIREYARIQTFPDNWMFKGTLSDQYKQIGNAVPVNLAWAVGRAIIRMLNEMEKDESFRDIRVFRRSPVNPECTEKLVVVKRLKNRDIYNTITSQTTQPVRLV